MKQTLTLAALLLATATSFAQNKTVAVVMPAKQKTQSTNMTMQTQTSVSAMKSQDFKATQSFRQSDTSANSAAAMGGHVGNGGGGVVRDGRYMTFYSAGLYTEPSPMTPQEMPPGLNNLINFVSNFPYWSATDKTNLFQVMMPSEHHQYFKVKKESFSQTTMDRLLAEYSRVTGQPVQGLELFAVTDIEKGQTFLLPSFYTLSDADQVAIMFHENVWLLTERGTNYEQVIAAEMALEAVYVEPKNTLRMIDLAEKFGDKSQILEAEGRYDLESGALKGLVHNGEIPFIKILGEDLLHCGSNTCKEGMVPLNIMRLAQQYPKSLILRHMAEKANINTDGFLRDAAGQPLYSMTYLDKDREAFDYRSAVLSLNPGTVGWVSNIRRYEYAGQNFLNMDKYEYRTYQYQLLK